MSDPRTFEARLRRALNDYSHRCPDDVDAVALAREIATSSSPAGRGIGIPWPFRRTRDPNPTWRTRTMAGALKLAAAVGALVAVGWVVTGVGGPRHGAVQVDDPSPSPSSLVGEDWAFFTGTVNDDGASYTHADPAHEENGVWISMGHGSRGDVQVTDDPRMNGTQTRTTNLYSDSPEDSKANLGSSLVTITNDEGLWTCPMTFIHYLTGRVGDSEIEQWAGWCEGSRAYEGLKAYLAYRQSISGDGQEIYGFIFSGDGPQMPEPPPD